MKKLILSVFVIACSMAVMATQTAFVTVKLAGSNPTYSVSQLYLIEDDARTAAVEDGYDAPCMMSQSNDNSTLLYGMIGGAEYSIVATNNLDGLAIGFKTNNVDQDYTLTFSDFDGEAFELFDLVAGTHFTVNGSTPAYNFSVTPAQVGRVAINDRFVINYVAPEFGICFIDNELQITSNPYAENVVVKDENGTKVKDVAPVTPYQAIDLSALAAGRYTVELADGARKFVIIKQ